MKFISERLKGNNERLVGIETDIAAEMEEEPDPEKNRALKALLTMRGMVIEANGTVKGDIANYRT